MRILWFVTFVVAVIVHNGVAAFAPVVDHTQNTALGVGYVPDGMSPDQWRKLKQQEQSKEAKKNFAAFGPRGFQSRSLQSFQSDLEKGKANHLMPMFNAKEKLKTGSIKAKDIPYMQRVGGSWDDADVGTKKKWSNADKKYAANAGGSPARVDYLGFVERGQTGKKSTANAKKNPPPPQTKKLFGLF